MNRVEALQVMQATEAQRTVGDNWREIIDPSFYTKAEFLEALCESMEVDQNQYKSKEGAYSQCKAMALAVWLAFYEEEEKRGKE
jgi:hypothetical protein